MAPRRTLVSHDIDEAISVGDRTLLMSGRPGRIVKSCQVEIASPREKHLEAVTVLSFQVLATLHAARL